MPAIPHPFLVRVRGLSALLTTSLRKFRLSFRLLVNLDQQGPYGNDAEFEQL